MRYQLSQSLALLPRCSDSWIWIAKPTESCVKKFIGARSVSARPLPVERPAKDELRRSITFSGHPSEPMVDQRGLSDTSPSNDCDYIDILVCPCCIQQGNIFIPTKD